MFEFLFRNTCNYLISIFSSSKNQKRNASQLVVRLSLASSSPPISEFPGTGLLVVHRVAIEDGRGDPRGAPVPVVRVAGLVLGGGAVPRWPFQLFLDNVPHHQGRVCAAHGDERVVAAQEADAGQHPGVHLRLVELSSRRYAWVPRKGIGNTSCVS